jgi:hypothetical protein
MSLTTYVSLSYKLKGRAKIEVYTVLTDTKRIFFLNILLYVKTRVVFEHTWSILTGRKKKDETWILKRIIRVGLMHHSIICSDLTNVTKKASDTEGFSNSYVEKRIYFYRGGF